MQPQRLTIGHDALLERFFVDELEAVGPQELEAAARCFGFGKLTVLGRAGHDLAEAGAAAFCAFYEFFKGIQAGSPRVLCGFWLPHPWSFSACIGKQLCRQLYRTEWSW